MKKYCTRCGHEFEAVGHEVICPACKTQAAEDAKRAAVLRAKRASWTGESVPVRISGRASTVIRHYGAENGMPFQLALDDLLKSTNYFKGVGIAWEDVEPYRSHRRDKSTTQDVPQDVPQEVKQAAGKPQEVKTAKESKTVKTSTSKTVKAAGKAASKATSKRS